MKHMIKHKLKQILIKFKLFPIVGPVYERIHKVSVNFSSEHRVFQRQMSNFYSQFINKGDLCFDVGAHNGNRADIFLKLGAKVVAVEPQKKCVEYLESTFGKNNNFQLVKKGLADKEGEMPISICEEAEGISTFSKKWKTGRFSNYKWDKEELVEVTTLDNLIKQFGTPAFCKIDVEGFEHQVLKGLSRPVIKYISFEFAREFLGDARDCVKYLVSLGYRSFNFSAGESMELFSPLWLGAENIFEKINAINDNLLWGDIYAKFSRK
jgi:FkbM family methyltransferase